MREEYRIKLIIITLILSSAFSLCPSIHAAEASTNTEVEVKLESTLSITTNATGGSLNIPITPSSSGTHNTGDLDVTVHTNNETGYKLTMNSTTEETALVHTTIPSAIISSTIAPLTTPTTLPNNQWGYNNWTDGQITSNTRPTTFYRIPGTTADTIRTTTDTTGPALSRLTFEARADLTLPSGTYTHTLTFTAVTNYVAPPIDGTMQGFSTSQCNALSAGTILKLKDTRDNTVYRVKKMVDGKCWMIDDLALDLSTDFAEKPAYNPSAIKINLGGMDTINQASFITNTPDYNIPNNGLPKASVLYNWCAALGDTSTNCSASNGAPANQTVLDGTTVPTSIGTSTYQPEITGICPAPFRLPKGGPEASFSNPNSTANDFVKLDIAMGGTGASRFPANTFAYFSGLQASDTFGRYFNGVLGGYYSGGRFSQQSEHGLWLTSTAVQTDRTYLLGLRTYTPFNQAVVYESFGNKFMLAAVRCLI